MSNYDFTQSNDNGNCLNLEAIAFTRQKTLERLTTETFCIFDFEYAYDLDNFDAYRLSEDLEGVYNCRWPYHHAVAGAWALFTYPAGASQPRVRRRSLERLRAGRW